MIGKPCFTFPVDLSKDSELWSGIAFSALLMHHSFSIRFHPVDHPLPNPVDCFLLRLASNLALLVHLCDVYQMYSLKQFLGNDGETSLHEREDLFHLKKIKVSFFCSIKHNTLQDILGYNIYVSKSIRMS